MFCSEMWSLLSRFCYTDINEMFVTMYYDLSCFLEILWNMQRASNII